MPRAGLALMAVLPLTKAVGGGGGRQKRLPRQERWQRQSGSAVVARTPPAGCEECSQRPRDVRWGLHWETKWQPMKATIAHRGPWDAAE